MKQERRIYYFDNNATTRVAPEVVEAMLPFLTEHWGNPSSGYSFGRRVAGRIEEARGSVAKMMMDRFFASLQAKASPDPLVTPNQ